MTEIVDTVHCCTLTNPQCSSARFASIFKWNGQRAESTLQQLLTVTGTDNRSFKLACERWVFPLQNSLEDGDIHSRFVVGFDLTWWGNVQNFNYNYYYVPWPNLFKDECRNL